MIRITRDIVIDDCEIDEQFIRASGPGGQNVNKVSTAVQLRYNVRASTALPPDVRARLIRMAGKRINTAGELMISAQRFRTQARNRADAREQLADMVRAAIPRPAPRIKTRPTAGARKRRLEGKRRHSEQKKTRSRIAVTD